MIELENWDRDIHVIEFVERELRVVCFAGACAQSLQNLDDKVRVI